ncbi:hypothetical protein SAMN05444321_0011 [Bradyrhizobium lablabi]|nr:hypothetical protein SAMN05444321_0011 [Bradyrhizobium lablabi]
MDNARKFVINLDSRPDRRREMQNQLDRIGWRAEFVKATRPDDKGPFPSVGARGCFLSHLDVLKRGLGSHIILMEDDLDFTSNFTERWTAAIKNLPDNWSIFYPASNVGNGEVNHLVGILQTHMVVFNRSVVGTIIQELDTIISRPGGHPLGGPMHVDGAYSTIRSRNPDIRTYAVSPPLGFQRSSRSDIFDGSFLARVNVLRLVTRVTRGLRKLRD